MNTFIGMIIKIKHHLLVNFIIYLHFINLTGEVKNMSSKLKNKFKKLRINNINLKQLDILTDYIDKQQAELIAQIKRDIINHGIVRGSKLC